MADIERWITVNGAHIPIMKGESRTRAVSNFIKGKQKARKDRYHQIYENMKDKGLSGEDAQTEAEMSTGYKGKRNVKGYSTDPYNRVKKATDAADETYKTFNKRVKNAEARLEEFRKNRLNDSDKVAEATRKQYPNYRNDELEYRRLHAARGVANREREYEENRLRNQIDSDRAFRDLNVAYTYQDELDRDYSGYKLKAGKETPAKRTIKGVGKTDTMKQADKSWENARDRADKRTNERLKNGNPMTLGETWDKYKRSYKAANTKRTKAYTYKMTDDNRRKAVNRLSNISTRLDKKMDKATGKALDDLGRKYAKNQQKIATIGGRYLVGDKEEWKRIRRGKNK